MLTEEPYCVCAASQVGPQWHAWLHYMSDDVPGTLKGYDGKAPSYTLAHNYNQTGRAGTPQQQPDRYYPPWHRNSRHYKGQFDVRRCHDQRTAPARHKRHDELYSERRG